MPLRILIILILFSIAPSAYAQTTAPSGDERPLTRREVRRWLTVTQDNAELSAQANQDLIAEISRRGVDFALTPEQEWSFQLLEASDELIQAIRDGLPADQRQAILDAADKRNLYNSFLNNYARADLTSRKTAYEAGQEFVRRYRSDSTVRDQITFINRLLPQIDRAIRILERNTRGRRRN